MRLAPLILLCNCIPLPKDGEVLSDYALRDVAIEGLGGEDALTAATALAVNGAGETFELGQGYNLSDHSESVGTHEFAFETDLTQDALYWDWSRLLTLRGVDQNLAWSDLIVGGRGIETDGDGVVSALAADQVASIRNLSAVLTPALALRAALEDGTRMSLGESVTVDGVDTQALSIVLDDAQTPLTLDINPDTGEVLSARITEEDQVLGDAVVSARFEAWAPALDSALRFPSATTLELDGEILHTATIWSASTSLGADSPLPTAAEAVGDGVADLYWARYGAGRAIWTWRFASVGQPVHDADLSLTSREVLTGAGVKLVSGGLHNSLLVGLDDGVVLIDVPSDETEVTSLFVAASDLFSGRTITTAVLTHAHHDHVGGLRALAAAGVTLVVPADDEEFVNTVLSAPFETAPDALALADLTPNVVTVPDGGSLTLGSGDQTVVLRPVSNTHCDAMIYAWVPSASAIYGSDLYAPDPDLSDEALVGDEATTAVELYLAVDNAGLQPELVVGASGSMSSWEEMVTRAFRIP